MPGEGTPFPFPVRGLTATGFLLSQKWKSVFILHVLHQSPRHCIQQAKIRALSPPKHFRRKRRGRHALPLLEEISIYLGPRQLHGVEIILIGKPNRTHSLLKQKGKTWNIHFQSDHCRAARLQFLRGSSDGLIIQDALTYTKY